MKGYPLSLEQVLTEGAGKEKLQAISDILKKYCAVESEIIAEKIFQKFKIYLEVAYDTIEIRKQPGADKVFEELKRREIYIVLNTGYDSETAHSILKRVGWKEGEQLDLVVTANDVVHNRPKPDMIEFAKKRLNVTYSQQIVKIGDSTIDIEEGRNAGCYLSIGITTGAQSRTQLEMAKPDYVINSLVEILPLIK